MKNPKNSKNYKNPKSITAAAFLVVLCACFLSLLGSVVQKARDETARQGTYSRPDMENLSYLSLVDWFETTCRTFCTMELPGRVQIKEINAAVNRLADKWIFESTEVVRLKNGHLSGAGYTSYDHDSLKESVTAFRDYAEGELGVPYLYIQAPCKLCKLDNELPLPDMSNENEQTDLLLQWLDGWGVDALDLRESLHNDGLDHYGSFFVTDHHWTPDTGLWAARTISEELNRRYGLGMDAAALSEDGFTRRTWEGVFLGSWGRKVTTVFAEPEDFTLPVPAGPVDVCMTRYGTEYSGGFEVLCDESQITPSDYYTGNSYGSLLYGDCGYIKIENRNRPDGPVIAMLRESFAGAAGPYLALSAGELHLIDARYYEGSILELLKDIQPDIVLSLMNVQCHAGAYLSMVS